MDVNSPQFERYEAEFMAVAEHAQEWEEAARPVLDDCPMYLCLYGENGLTPEDEFAFLERFNTLQAGSFYKLLVEADYYQDVILFIPK